MRWSVEVAHECGHVVIGLLMGGELQNASADLGDGTGRSCPCRVRIMGMDLSEGACDA